MGATIGVFAGSKIKDRTRELVTDILGLVTLIGAAQAIAPIWNDSYLSSLPKGWGLLSVLAAMIIGGLIGSAFKLENRLDNFGEYLRVKFRAKSESSFIEGFVNASLLFVIGPLAILGSISDGMSRGIDQLLLKSILDMFAAMAFAASLGWGVAASAIAVGIYQGAWTVIGALLGNILAGYQVDCMTITGGLMLVAIALRLLRIRQIAVGNLLPALFLAPLVALALHQFN
jgi:uncharacterized membrane protein YqgA involved in biofilm formation